MNGQNKKRGPIQRVKDWWNGLTEGQQIGICCATWFIAGLTWGAGLNEAKNQDRIQYAAERYETEGYILGKMDAYKEMANAPTCVHKNI